MAKPTSLDTLVTLIGSMSTSSSGYSTQAELSKNRRKPAIHGLGRWTVLVMVPSPRNGHPYSKASGSTRPNRGKVVRKTWP